MNLLNRETETLVSIAKNYSGNVETSNFKQFK